MVRGLLGNLTPQILIQALNSVPPLATSSLKMGRRVETRRSDLSDGSGGKHNKVVLEKDLNSNTQESE